MNNTTKTTTRLAAIAGLALTFSSAHAAVTIDAAFSGSFTEVNDGADQAYSGDQSGSDLIEGLTATTATGWNLTNGSELKDLNDGEHGAFPGGQADGLWSNPGAVVEYNLGANALGYDITGIQSIASWSNVGFGNQVWTVEVLTVGGNPASDYQLLATVDYVEFSNAGGSTKVNMTGLDATGIEFIKFTAGATGTGGSNSIGDAFVFREMDVFGTATAVPEPSAAALLGLGGLTLILRRRK